MLMWKKEDQLVALAEQVLTSNTRMSVTRLAEGTRLTLILAEREDAGLYTCQLSALQSVQQVHDVVVRGIEFCNNNIDCSLILMYNTAVSPVVTPEPQSGHLTVQAGHSARLGCVLNQGIPRPRLTWRHQVTLYRSNSTGYQYRQTTCQWK